jgi:hypothetical protein
MKALLTFSALVAVLGLVARADDDMNYSTDPILDAAPPAVVTPIDAAGMTVPMMMPPALPHYHGRGEWPGYGGGCGCAPCGCGAPCPCEGCTWGCCPRPCNAHLDLWDGYCCEITRCPGCGYRQGSLLHHLHCGSSFHGCGTWCAHRGCAGASCANGGCAGRHGAGIGVPAKGPTDAAHDDHSAPPPPPMTDEKPPAKSESAKPGADKDMPMDMPEKAAPEKTGAQRRDRQPTKASRVVPVPRQTNLLDRLIPWRTSGAR